MVEIRKDGKPIHAHDREFQFTPVTARMLVDCIEVIRWFAEASEKERDEFRGKLVDGRILVTTYMDFETSDGTKVERPYLQLQSLSGNDMRRGLGVMKCRAICELENELRHWIQKHLRS